MSHLLHRRRGHDSEDEDDDDDSIVSGMTTTDSNYATSDEDSQDETETETESEYDSSEQETDTESEQEDEVEQQPEAAVVVEASTQEMQQTITTTDGSSSQPADIKEEVHHQPTKPPSPVTAPCPVNTVQTVDMDYQDLQQQQQEKTIQELREYRRKLAEDPSFVPYVGLFWGHDDRYREDSLVTTTTTAGHGHHEATRESMPRFSQHTAPHSSSIKKPSYDRNLDPLMHKKWDHSGYEELMRLEEEEERQKRELIKSGQSPLQVNQHRLPAAPRLPRYHHYNNNARGRAGGGYRGGQHHHSQPRYGQSQKRSLNQQEEWPQLASTSAATAAEGGGDTTDQVILDNNKTQQQQTKVDAWGSVDTHEEAKPIVKEDQVTDGWGTSTTTANAAEDGWGSAPSETQIAAAQETPKQDSPKTHTVEQAGDGWGALPESTPTRADVSATANASSQDNWNAPAPAITESNTNAGWGEQPTIATTVANDNDGWNTVVESKDVSGWATTTEPVSQVKTPSTTTSTAAATAQKAMDHKEIDTPTDIPAMPSSSPSAVTSTTDGWGKPDDTPAQDTWSNTKAQDWQTTTPQWDATAVNHSSSKGKEKQHEIPAEEKASSSWANVNLDVQVHTTPSDFTKIDYSHNSRRYGSPRRDNSDYQHLQQQATLDEPSMQQQGSNATPDQWGADASTTPHSGWHTTTTTAAAEENVHTQGEWATTTSPKSEEATQVNAGWNARATSSWNAASEAKATSSWNAAPEATTTTNALFDQSHSSSSSSVRGGGGGWSNSRSSNSANWNADREWNNKMRQEQQGKKSRGYFSGKNTDIHTAVETASNSTDGFHTPETSAWGHFHSTGDDDSDVEIILEAEEEPEWSKEDEQVLGMTAPADTTQQSSYSPHASSKRSVTKSYLSQHQHDSGQSSPRPEYNRKPTAAAVNGGGRHGNNNKSTMHSHRTDPYDDHWRHPREEAADAYRPMYYPTPVAHHHHHHPSYMPMIPNGNGAPMYALPYPMGLTTTTSPSSSSPPPHTMAHRGDSANSTLHKPSSSTSPHKFYTPSPPNVVQQLPPGYEANGMVYYGMDPSAMYPPPQAFYYYAPPPPPPPPPQQQQQAQTPQHMMTAANEGYDASMRRRSSLSPRLHLQQVEEDGWGPTPDTVETEVQWRSTTMNKSSHQQQQHYDFQNRKQQQQQPVNQQYYHPQHGHHH